VKLLTIARDLKRRRAREREQLFVAEGVRAVEEVLASSLRVRGVLVAPQLDLAPRGAALHEAVRQQSVSRDFGLAEVNEQEFRSAAETESPQGVIAIVQIPERSFVDIAAEGPLRLLVLDGVQDPGNVGTMLRTAAALGVTATVALPGTVDLWNAKVVRSAMGAHFRHYAFHASLDDLEAYLLAQGVTLWATDTQGVPVEMLAAPDRLAIAVGNEGAGVSPALARGAAQTVALPTGQVESLNVAVATGVFLYVLRLRI
jgi:RNA methyltransferase, TrmH family